jgi:hypothetical protein
MCGEVPERGPKRLRGDSIDEETNGADVHLVARTQLAANDPRAIDQSAVGRLEILQHPMAVAESQARVPPRDAEVVEHDVARQMAADKELVVAAVPNATTQSAAPTSGGM